MKIINRVEPKKRTCRLTCGDCGSVLEVEPQDVHSDQRDGDYIICPVCKSWNSVERMAYQQTER